ncbi:MAG: 50S ribosomal protein L29 [Candidatus Altiarchaeota archaeon]|nr:50S ribosomal protein L29 [Candidatus Altiarchaeota archaeon]
MVILRAKEIREMGPEQIEARVKELYSEYSKMKSQIRSGGAPENSGKMREIRKTIARLKTIYKEKSSN